jgi:AcrR family transcriptional regulator
MSKAFTEKEKERIKEKIFTTAKGMFSHFGYKKTSIREITKKIGISQGAFYTFYNSKEELFFNILQNEAIEMRNNIFSSISVVNNSPKNVIKDLFYKIIEEIEKNKMFEFIIFNNEFQEIFEDLSEDHIKAHRMASVIKMNEWIKNIDIFKENLDLENMINCFRALIILYFNRKLLGNDAFKNTIDFLLEGFIEKILK